MGTIVRKFAGTPDSSMASIGGTGVPRVGDHVVLDSGTLYCISQVLWDSTSNGINEIVVYLDPVQHCGFNPESPRSHPPTN